MSRGRSLALYGACGIAGVSLAIVLAPTPQAGAQETTTAPTTTSPPTTPPVTTTTAPVTTAPSAARPKKPAGPRIIQPGVTIGGILVGGLTVSEARDVVQRRFLQPVTLVVSKTRKLRVEPTELGARAKLGKAVETAARVRSENFRVPLSIDVPTSRLQRFLARLGRDTRRTAVDSRLILRKLKPFATRSQPGRRLQETMALREIRRALKLHDREPIALPFQELRPQVTEQDLGQVIVIRRNSRRLLYYKGAKLTRAFRVATGQPSYPTPLGKYEIITKWRDPWWYPPPDSAWAQGAKPIPPGPGNPLGTRWMGISAPYVGIHGTPDAASIGYSASHGCVRMLVPEAEWLFERVELGTPVFIVPA